MRSLTTNSHFIRFLVLILLGMVAQASHAQNYTLTIQVADSTLIPVGNATIRINKQERVVDSAGNIQLHLPAGAYRIHVSAVGHYATSLILTLDHDTTLPILLSSRESLLRNVVVTASRNVHRNQMSTQSLNISQIKKLPVILGEVDPLKTITLLPGIKNGGEASAGIYVRGGGPDQNLVLLDGIPVYNPNHLLGFSASSMAKPSKILRSLKAVYPPNMVAA
ncbi:TonB-dependent receptor [Paraflavitalea speifideaquila]|uniref:carboxypeptidase-like regulatory domain-containing protein n=1 Tax=Paraflavitalea speifideaquila TaxID=3076558 RepID=UPI0028E6454A|nr:TonB-dependent receptor [Paraflavitalea speifideiaquila]